MLEWASSRETRAPGRATGRRRSEATRVGPPEDEAVYEAMTVQEVADRLRVDENTVYRLLDRGSLGGVKVGRVWRVPVAALEEFIQGGGSRGAESSAMPRRPGKGT